jgi:hypothetical protein
MHDDLDAALAKLPDGLKHVDRVASEPVELRDNQRLTFAKLPQHSFERRSLTGCNLAGHALVCEPVVSLDLVTGCLQFESLILCGLLPGRDSTVSERLHDPYL